MTHKNNPSMVSAFPLALTIAQTKSFFRILQRHIDSLHMNSILPLNVRILQVLTEIMEWFYLGKFQGFMLGGLDESPLLSKTIAEHPILLASVADTIRLGVRV